MDNRVLSLTYVLQLEQGITEILKEHPFGHLIAKCLIAWSSSLEVGDIIDYSNKEPDGRIKTCMKANVKWLFEGSETLMKRCWEQNGVPKYMYPDKTYDDFRNSIVGNKAESEKIKRALTDYISRFEFKHIEQPTEKVNTSWVKNHKAILFAPLVFVAFIVITGLASMKNDKTDAKGEVGEYVYVDAVGTIHANKNCLKENTPKQGTSKEVQYILMEGVEFVETNSLTKYYSRSKYSTEQYRFCPTCISDEAYEQINEIMLKNE